MKKIDLLEIIKEIGKIITKLGIIFLLSLVIMFGNFDKIFATIVIFIFWIGLEFFKRIIKDEN